MADWNDLPNELTTIILRFFAFAKEGLNRRDAVSVMLVSYRFRSIMEPLAYASVHLSCSRRRGLKRDIPYARLLLFTRTIISRPCLGSLVKDLFIRCDGKPSRTLEEVIEEGVRECNDHVSDEEAGTILAALPDAWRDDMNILASAAVQKGFASGLVLRGGCPGLLILLLHLLPSLVSFSADCTHEFAAVTFAACGYVQGGIPAGLRSITSINISLALSYKTDATLNVVLPFMFLPSVTEVSCHQVVGCGESDLFLVSPIVSSADDSGDQVRTTTRSTPDLLSKKDRMTIASKGSPVTHMSFSDSVIENATLGLMLTFPRQLESLRYSIHTEVYEPAFVPGLLHKGLCSQKDSLIELSITCESWWNCDTGGDWFLGSLSDFGCLKYLQLPAAALITLNESPSVTTKACRNPLDDLLPSSLVTVELDIGRIAFSDTALGNFLTITGLPYTLSLTSQYLPKLRTFHVIGCGCEREHYWQSWRHLPFWDDEDSWSVGHKIKFTMEN